MSSVYCFLKLLDVLGFKMMRSEYNGVCPVVIPTLNIFQVFPLSFFGAELQTHLKTAKKNPFCGKTHPKEASMCEILRLAVSIDELLCNHLDHTLSYTEVIQR